MRVDDLGPRTWLLAGLAAWALLGWLLAVAGMGGRVGSLTDDPALLAALPAPVPAPVAVLGPPEQYAEIAARPLFAVDRRPHPFFLEGGEGETSSEGFDYVLTSVLITPGLKLAIIQPSGGSDSLRVKLDQAIDPQSAWRLVELDPRSAVFEGPEGRRTLPLRVFDGVGGMPPTAIQGDNGTARQATSPAPDLVPATPPLQEASALPPRNPTEPPNMKPETGDAKPPTPTSERDQMDAIRKRIEARRASLRNDP